MSSEIPSGNEGGFAKLPDGRYRLSDGRVFTQAQMDQAFETYLETEELKDAEAWARRNRDDLTMLYDAIARASRWGEFLEDKDAQDEVAAAIDRAHGEVLSDTYAIAVSQVEPMSAVTLAALIPGFEGVEQHYRQSAEQGKSIAAAFVKSPVLQAPSHIEGVTPKNLVQAMTVAATVKWVPIRGYHDGKRFFVTPFSKDWDVLRKLDATPEGQDWVDIAYARSEHDTEDTLPG